MDILRLFYYQDTTITNPIIVQSVLFTMFCLITLNSFIYHFCRDYLLYKIIVLKKAKINAVYNPPKADNSLFVQIHINPWLKLSITSQFPSKEI